MITPEGYSKNSIPPDGIAITWGKDLINEKGGLLPFLRRFENFMSEDKVWYQKCITKPKYDDLLYVYVIICGRVYYKLLYGGYYSTGCPEAHTEDAESWCSGSIITWPHIVLAGPVEKAPYKIYRSGFQNFRYCIKLF